MAMVIKRLDGVGKRNSLLDETYSEHTFNRSHTNTSALIVLLVIIISTKEEIKMSTIFFKMSMDDIGNLNHICYSKFYT